MEGPVNKKRNGLAKYSPLVNREDYVDILGPLEAIVQSAHTLDIACKMAIHNNDYAFLAELSDKWMNVASLLSSGMEEEEEEFEEIPSQSFPFGFSNDKFSKEIQEVKNESGTESSTD